METKTVYPDKTYPTHEEWEKDVLKKNTITITYTEKVHKEEQIQLPYYTKDNCHWYKVYSQERCLEIHESYGDLRIEVQPAEIAFHGEKVPCTAEEFNAKFQEVKSKLESLI